MTRKAPEFLFVGAHPALDFVNTWTMDRGHPVERIRDFRALLRWVQSSPAALPAEDRDAALARWADHPDGPGVRERLVALREAVRRWLREASTAPALAALVDEALNAPDLTHRVRALPRGFRPFAVVGDAGPAVLLRLQATAVRDLLCEVKRASVRACASKNCEVWFRVEGRTVVRRWCSDARCGSRHRTARYEMHRPGRTRLLPMPTD
jgi:predicted RNA-binding Zn ribbon-like protein